MKKTMLFILLFLCACEGYIHQPAIFKNGYFQSGIYYNMFREAGKGSNHTKLGYFKSDGMWHLLFLDQVVDRFAGVHDLSGGFYITPLIMDFYQDKNKQCYLFSYTLEELKQMKLAAGFSLKNSSTIFLLTKEGLQVISKTKYKQLIPTLKPHPYDPTLCRPKPEHVKNAKYY